jgi:hypothetical protein
MMMLAYARRLRDIGLSVFPIPVGTKTPVIAWKPYQDRLATDDELAAWFSDGPSNLGIVTGALSGVVVIDMDNERARYYLLRHRHLPRTPWHTQTPRGWHLWFAHPGFPIANRSGLQTEFGRLSIDLRGDGGYVLAGGSLHPSGTVYRTSVHPPRPDLPRFWPNWLEPVKPPKTKTAANGTPVPPRFGDAFLVERARRYLAAIPPPIIGAGSDALTLKAACRLVRGFELLAVDAEELLWEWAGNRDGWDRAWIAEKVRNAERYGREVMGGLR